MLEKAVLTTSIPRSAAQMRQYYFWGLLFVGLGLLVFAILLSLASGPIHISFSHVLSLLESRDGSVEDLVFHTSRLPRTFVALLAGAAFAVAGVIMQGVTRNPLACPSLLGINQGAALSMILMLLLLPNITTVFFVPTAFLGGLAAAVLIYGMTTIAGLSTLQLALAGIIVNALFHAVSRALLILYPTSAQAVMFNIMGSLAGRTWQEFHWVLPWIAVCLFLSFFLHRPLTIFALGQEKAIGLGVSARAMQCFCMLIAVILAAAAVSVAGPIPFMGLMVPSALRYVVGNHYKQLMILSMVYGALLLTLSDALIRVMNPVVEIPVGLVVALMGGPFFVFMARAQTKEEATC
jgi:iron complex transport system permease protein